MTAAGRDHWPGCYTALPAGGGVRGGQAVGKSDDHAAEPAENPLTPQDLIATIYRLMGISPRPGSRTAWTGPSRP